MLLILPWITIFIAVSSLQVKAQLLKDNHLETFKDPRDGKVYKTVQIGTQVWMAENFAYLPEVGTENVSVYGYEGNSIKEAKATTSYKKYGALYSWEYAKKLAPEGWRLATDADWQQLERAIGMTAEEANSKGWRGQNNEANLLKEGGNFGFDVRFGGWRTDFGEFRFQGQHANFWVADDADEERAQERLIGLKNGKIGRELGNKGCGFSVRYIRDLSVED